MFRFIRILYFYTGIPDGHLMIIIAYVGVQSFINWLCTSVIYNMLAVDFIHKMQMTAVFNMYETENFVLCFKLIW